MHKLLILVTLLSFCSVPLASSPQPKLLLKVEEESSNLANLAVKNLTLSIPDEFKSDSLYAVLFSIGEDKTITVPMALNHSSSKPSIEGHTDIKFFATIEEAKTIRASVSYLIPGCDEYGCVNAYFINLSDLM